jgi:hypothetical protein
MPSPTLALNALWEKATHAIPFAAWSLFTKIPRHLASAAPVPRRYILLN